MGDESNTYVWTSRSQPRDQETGEIAFDISFNVGLDDEEKKRVRITTLMDLDDLSFEYEEVTDAVNDWLAVAKNYPDIRRNCLCCRRRATKSKVLCGWCGPKYGPTIEAKEEAEVKEDAEVKEEEHPELCEWAQEIAQVIRAEREQGTIAGSVWYDAPIKTRTGK